jgi:hypothetical protein
MTDIRIQRIGTHLKVLDFEASRRFYDAMGFQKTREFGPDAETRERYRGAVYAVGSAFVEISEGHKPVKPEVFEEHIQSSKVSLMVNVESLIPVLEACEKHNIEIAVPCRTFPWGVIELIVKDPDGFVIGFNANYSEAEAEKVQLKSHLPIDRDTPDYTDDHVDSIRRRTTPRTRGG